MTIRPWAVVVVVVLVTGCGGGSPPASKVGAEATARTAPGSALTHAQQRRGSATTVAAPRNRGGALVALAALPVKGRAPMTGYSRRRFGDGWLTVHGCDMRDRMLRRDLSRKTVLACRVLSGRLSDPYTDTVVTFARGGASEVDIDHVVSLGDAWQTGAQRWSGARRVALANDPLNLLSVDAGANRQKGDGDAATWLPANKAFRCRYVARQIAVKGKYGAWVTRAEHDAMTRVLARCPRQPLPTSGRARVRVVTRPTTAPASTERKSRRSPSRRGRVFANCDAVRAAGLAPLRRGTADYSANPGLDRDHDGLGCE